MTLDEAIKHCEEVAEENEEIYEAHCRIYSKEVVEKYPSPPCKKCADEHRQLAEWLKELKAYKEQTGDAISRKHLLEEIAMLKKSPWFNENTYGSKVIRKEAVEFVEDVCIKREPSVTPQQRTGRWIPVGYDGYADGNPVYDWWECSKCGWEHTGDEESLTAFCPNCGAKMEV